MPTLKNFYDEHNKGKAYFTSVCLIAVLVLLRETVSRHVIELWSVSGVAVHDFWVFVYKLFNESDAWLFLVATHLVGLVVLVAVNVFFAFLDLTGKPEFLMKYKIQDAKPIPVDWVKYKKCLKQVIFNNTVVSVAFQLVAWPVWKWRGVAYRPEDLPTFPYFILHFAFYLIMEEIFFYYFHRLFHHPFLYKRVHKIHHEWTAPVALAASYCHPIEHFMVNTLSIQSGPILLGSHFHNHLLSSWVWIIVAVVVTTVHHSCYHLPFLSSPEHHDFHHSKFHYMYGVLGILDYIHGTDSLYRNSKESKRHFVLLGTASAKEIVPDSKQ